MFCLAFLHTKMTSIYKGHDSQSPRRVKIREWNGCGAISRGRWYVHSSVKSNVAYSAFLLISPLCAIGRGFPLPYISERKPSGTPRGIAPAPIGQAMKTRQNRRGRALSPRQGLQHLGQNFGVPPNSNKCFRGLLFTFSILGFHFLSHSFTFSKNFYEIC